VAFAFTEGRAHWQKTILPAPAASRVYHQQGQKPSHLNVFAMGDRQSDQGTKYRASKWHAVEQRLQRAGAVFHQQHSSVTAAPT
jgi:hypothetical protein